jgi:hypothetical protein
MPASPSRETTFVETPSGSIRPTKIDEKELDFYFDYVMSVMMAWGLVVRVPPRLR